MDLPEQLTEILREAEARHRNDLDQAVVCAEEMLKKQREYPLLWPSLLPIALRALIHDIRKHRNEHWRHDSNMSPEPPGKPKVTAAAANSVAMESFLSTYSIDGRVLGWIRGDELPRLAERQRNYAAASMFHARFFEALAPKVKGNKRVADCLTDAEALAIFRRVQNARCGDRSAENETANAPPRVRKPEPAGAGPGLPR